MWLLCEKFSLWERGGGAGNVQHEHFLPDNAAFFTELSNSSTTNWVLEKFLKDHIRADPDWPPMLTRTIHKQWTQAHT